jgi:hypothetical protein
LRAADQPSASLPGARRQRREHAGVVRAVHRSSEMSDAERSGGVTPNDEDDELLPSQVRARAIRAHVALRAAMQRVREAAEAAAGDGASESLRREVGALAAAVGSVIELEEEILVPTLRGIDAWGPERARRLAAWHREERERKDELERAMLGPRPAEAARRYVERLEGALAAHEAHHLEEELLRELPIPTDLGGA